MKIFKRIVLSVLAFIYIIFILFYGIFLFSKYVLQTPNAQFEVFGTGFANVNNPGIRNIVPQNSIAVFKAHPNNLYKEGQAVVFISSDNKTYVQQVKGILSAGDNGVYLIATDRNANIQVNASNILGEVTYSIPYLGVVFSFLATALGFIIVIILPILVVLVIMLINLIKSSDKDYKQFQKDQEKTSQDNIDEYLEENLVVSPPVPVVPEFLKSLPELYEQQSNQDKQESLLQSGISTISTDEEFILNVSKDLGKDMSITLYADGSGFKVSVDGEDDINIKINK